MGTRSTIAIKNEDGSIEGIYCHWDGYLSWNGRILLNNYTTEEKVRELISMGDVSSLGEEIHPYPNVTHTWENKQEGVYLFYNRDRGEHTRPIKAICEADFYSKSNIQQYNYLFKDGKWFWMTNK